MPSLEAREEEQRVVHAFRGSHWEATDRGAREGRAAPHPAYKHDKQVYDKQVWVGTVLEFRRKQHKQVFLAICCFRRNSNTVPTPKHVRPYSFFPIPSPMPHCTRAPDSEGQRHDAVRSRLSVQAADEV